MASFLFFVKAERLYGFLPNKANGITFWQEKQGGMGVTAVFFGLGQGIGRTLLLHCEGQVPPGGFWFVKVLKRAPWAQRFYLKNGYSPLDAEREGLAASLGIVPKDWSLVYWKKV